ncbi:MAG TPA: hypothetical protein VF753_05455 [Terriglobales bacterium]
MLRGNRNCRWREFASLLIVSGLSAALLSCGSTSVAPYNTNSLSAVTVQVSPPSASVKTGHIMTFSAYVNNSSLTTVTWLVNGVVGGTAFTGTIDKNGNYTAPLFVPIQPQVTVTAAANADNSSQGNALVSLSGTPLPVRISPTEVNLYFGGIALLTADVGLKNPEVVWSVANVPGGNTAYGTVTPLPGDEDKAIYVAPLTSNQSQIPVTAVSIENKNYFASSTVNLRAAPPGSPEVTLKPSYLNPPTVPAGWQQTFQATVKDAKSENVIWYVDGVQGGNSFVGTIVPGPDNTAVFTGPGRVPNPNQVYVTAASVDLVEAQASTPVLITPAPKLAVTISQANVCQNLGSVPAGTQIPFTAVVTGSPNQAVTWEVNQVAGGNDAYGTITDNGIYTAPAVIPSNPNLIISGVSQLDHRTTGTLVVRLAATPTYAVVVTPKSMTVDTCPNCGGVEENISEKRPKKQTNTPPDVVLFTSTTQFSGENPTYGVDWSVTHNGNDNGKLFPQTPIEGAPPCQDTANYDAPPTVPKPSTINVTAAMSDDPQVSGSAAVKIVQGPAYSVQLDPPSATLSQGGMQQFNATVFNGKLPADNQNVSWDLSSPGLDCSAVGNPCGTVNPTFGNGQTGYKGIAGTLYTAPASITTGFTVTLTAVAQVDTAIRGTATITLESGLPSIAINPSSAGCPANASSGDPCTDKAPNVSFTLFVQNLPSSDAVLWEISCISLFSNSFDECKSSEFNNPLYNGPGCINDGSLTQCAGPGGLPNTVPLTDTLTYTPPQNLETGEYKQEGSCSVNDGVNGYVYITAIVSDNTCPFGQCSATACIKICPAGSPSCPAPQQ